MKEDKELEMLLDEIPHAVALNLDNVDHHHDRVYGDGDHHRDGVLMTQNSNAIMYGDDTVSRNNNNHNHPTCASSPSPASGFPLHSDGSYSNLGGYSFPDNGSPTTSPGEETKPYSLSGTGNHPNRLPMEFNTPDYSVQKTAAATAAQNVADEINLSMNLGRLYISDESKDAKLGGNGGVGLQHQYPRSRILGLPFSSYSVNQADDRFPQFNPSNVAVNSQSGYMTVPGSNLFGTQSRVSVAQRNNAIFTAENDAFGRGANIAHSTHVIPPFPPPTIEGLLNYQLLGAAYNILPVHVSRALINLEIQNWEDGLIMQGDSLNYGVKKGYGFSRGNINNKGSSYGVGVNAYQGKRSLFNSCTQNAANQESTRRRPRTYPFPLPSKYDSLSEVQGNIYNVAKDQHGCRFLQRIFDEGTPQDVRLIFGEIIDHVVELMMNPFGNYLMQKLLEVCNEEQRMEILIRVTARRGQLIRISFNIHGTRVVQKLIETLKSSQETSLVISALEPGFLALIKDLNGNHVIQRCLYYLSEEDCKFIFVAAAKYCVDIATHQHGCCVLQKCIEYSSGELRENLIEGIVENGLLLAQDAFGNYAVQFILDLNIPSVTSKLLSQFEGSYVHLSTQKFSSHVVEKCLGACDEEVLTETIHELLSAPHFEQLLLDPHANYVVQTALKVSEGALHNLLVDVIGSHKSVTRFCPFSKSIFSRKLLKK